MRERKYIKFRTDMYEDTKFKIIDTKPNRDLIHYAWTRLVALAGKVNLEGDLYMSRNIPYTVETLAIEFNREADQIRSALEVFIELEMIELTEANVYRVINFAKHQNIKRIEKNKSKNEAAKLEDISKEKLESKTEVDELNRDKNTNNEIKVEEGKLVESCESKSNKDALNFKISGKENKEFTDEYMMKINTHMNKEALSNSSRDKPSINLEVKKSKRINKKRKNGITCEITDQELQPDDVICWVSDGEMTLAEGHEVVSKWAFN
ncbi:phage replisome organizer N-terminal domain-containing protein [uncultured Clostridium sp.]|uniref:phage replisome organizer N-terminal domain-containing protein n=1 Tax=uncultured Clostridium sp. TaxID=59620 RepID=UPI0028E91751|nr:phage replisome organizer N-terminal domain-containing protein [uncultured Clostridium sp.]